MRDAKSSDRAGPTPGTRIAGAMQTVAGLCSRYQIGALRDFLESCREFARDNLLNIAVLGRFKAGKSSFLNQILGRKILPVGAVPVTAIVTEVQWGPVERVEVRFTDGAVREASVEELEQFVSEARNPSNEKGVVRVSVDLPSLSMYRGIRFVDTPGLDSVFAHNTGTALNWLPHTGLALVAVGVDTPLSQRDIDLIRGLSRYTSNISVLLTKVDMVTNEERAQVLEFVEAQLRKGVDGKVRVFPYSIRPGFEQMRAEFAESLLARMVSHQGEERHAILRHKVDSLLGECAGYLRVALSAARAGDAEQERIRQTVLGGQEPEDARHAILLIVRNAMAGTRPALEAMLRDEEKPIRLRLAEQLDRAFDGWASSLSGAVSSFEDWLRASLTAEIVELSRRKKPEFLQPIDRTGRQLQRSLQDFRNRISERVLTLLGVPLQTTEMELLAPEPSAPNILVGKVFDHNWELVSWLVPMGLVRGAVRKHFHRRLEYLVFANQSRLVAQWEDAVHEGLLELEKQATQRLDSFAGTVIAMIHSSGEKTSQLEQDIALLQRAKEELAACQDPDG